MRVATLFNREVEQSPHHCGGGTWGGWPTGAMVPLTFSIKKIIHYKL